ncbi:MAG: aldose 1-epimerase [Acidimicrobiales bacterium]
MHLDLASDAVELRVDLTNGGRLASLVVHGHELLVGRRDDPLAWGCYPMVPFAGRIDQGVLTWRGANHQLPAVLGRHAIHGYGFTSPWTRVDDHTIAFELMAPWPYAGTVTQRFDLTDEHLDVGMTLRAVDAQPVSLGWHPWFLRELNGATCALELDAEWMYEIDDEIPTGQLAPPPPGPWDNCFTGLRSNPRLRWGDLSIELSSSADHWIVYDMPDHALCVEPQTGPPNDVNTNPTVVDAGEEFAITFRIAWG